jgi:hypothetical protein
LFTADGLRCEEVFGGLDRSLLGRHDAALLKQFGGATAEARRELLLPFFWKTIAAQGIVLGNRHKGSEFRLANPHRFSYPGYAEILTGQYVKSVDSNDPVRIPQETVLEFVRRKFDLDPQQTALFASWDVLKVAAASNPDAVFSNAGYDQIPPPWATPGMEPLNGLQRDLLTPWDSVRQDSVTFHLALEYLKARKPRLLHIALGQPDDWSHESRYDRALQSIQLFDRCLETLWNTLESLDEYRGRTTLIVTTDHGRGAKRKNWKSHGKRVEGAQFVWLAVIGPDTPSRGEAVASPSYSQNQTAATILRLLGLSWQEFNPAAGPPIEAAFRE